jgi:cell division septum initiation protein DivIVA
MDQRQQNQGHRQARVAGHRRAKVLPWRQGWRIGAVGLLIGLALTPLAGAADEAELRGQIERLLDQMSRLQQRLAQLEARLPPAPGEPAPLAGDSLASRLPANLSKASATAAASSPELAAATRAAQAAAASAATFAEQARASAASAAATAGMPGTSEPTTTLGGYGELNYNRYLRQASRSQADLRRFVLSLNHRFDERLTFTGELEWEHAVASADDQGEAEVEQAWLGYAISPSLNLKAGLFLMPFGFLNTSHEPPTFRGVERNEVETRIIPTTWREGGLGLTGTTESGWTWELGGTTGFSVSKFSDSSAPLASVHQEMQRAQARDVAGYGALAWRGVPGLLLGGALFRGNAGQGNASYVADPAQPDLGGVKATVTLWETHARWQSGRLDLQALYARGSIGDADRIDAALLAWNAANGANRPMVPGAFYGWYLQGGWRAWSSGDRSLSPFVRYERYDTQHSMPAGYAASSLNADRLVTVGLSWHVHPQVVFKADYQRYLDNPDNSRFNLGAGYMF